MALSNVPLTSRLDNTVEVLEKKLEKLSDRIRVASPGIIQSFDPVKQVVTVQIAIREKYAQQGKPYVDKTIPILAEVPIYMPRAGNFVLTMPIKVGDECLVIFSDCCYDAWWETGAVSNQMDNRRHDLSDGFAIVGPWSQPKVFSDYSTDSARLRNLLNDSYVEVKDSDINIVTPTKITITAGSEVEVNASIVDVNATTVTIDAETITATVTTATVTASASATVTAPSIQLSGGLVTLIGTSGVTITGGGLSSIDSKNFLSHAHSGVQGGLGNTGGVV